MTSLNTAPAATVTEQPTDDTATPARQQPTAANTVVRWGPGEMGRGCCWTLFTCPYRASQASCLSSITEQERDFANFCNVRSVLTFFSLANHICSGFLLAQRASRKTANSTAATRMWVLSQGGYARLCGVVVKMDEEAAAKTTPLLWLVPVVMVVCARMVCPCTGGQLAA